MKKIIFLVLIQFFVSFNLFSQYYFYVSPLNERAKPNQQEKGMSKDEALNKIFKEFEVRSYQQSFPGAKNAELQSFYEIHFAENKENRNVDAFEELLKNSRAFAAIYRSDYYELAVCNNPVAINDEWIITNRINNNALKLLDAQCAWTITKGDPNIIVAVIDTEFETTHEDLTNKFIGIVGTQTDPTNHGTAVSGCVTAETNNNKGIAGIGYNTRVKGYHTSGSDLWNKIWQAYQEGIKIINVSWTGIGSYPNLLAVQEMTNNGVVLVVGAGNIPSHVGSHQAYANIPGVINVSGVDSKNTHSGVLNSFGINNQWVDVCTLSSNVAVCTPGNTYSSGYGTSFAAPQVAGVVALIRSINGNLSPAEIENIIKSTTDSIADAHLFPGLIGTGRVNAYKAVQAACTPMPTTFNFTNQPPVTVDKTVTYCKNINVQNITVTNGAKLTIQAGGSIIVQGVTVNNNSKIILDANGEVNIISDFDVQIGSEFEIVYP